MLSFTLVNDVLVSEVTQSVSDCLTQIPIPDGALLSKARPGPLQASHSEDAA